MIKTPRADFIREILNTHMRDVDSSSSGNRSSGGWLSSRGLDWDTSRGSDFRGLAQAVYIMDVLDQGVSSSGVGYPALGAVSALATSGGTSTTSTTACGVRCQETWWSS